MKRNDLDNFKHSVQLAIDSANQAINMSLDLMHQLFNHNNSNLFSSVPISDDFIKWFPELYEIDLRYTEWEDKRYSISFFLSSLSDLSERFISMKVLIKDMLPSSLNENFDLLNAVNFYPCLLHLVRSVAKLTKMIEDEYKSMDWEYEDMRDYEPYNRVKKFISHNLSYYAKKHQAPIVEDFCKYALKSLEKFADGKEIGNISFDFFYPGEHDNILCEFNYDCVKIARYGWNDDDTLDERLIIWWSYTLHEDGCGEGEIWWGNDDISEEIDNGMQLTITEPDEFSYGHDDS